MGINPQRKVPHISPWIPMSMYVIDSTETDKLFYNVLTQQCKLERWSSGALSNTYYYGPYSGWAAVAVGRDEYNDVPTVLWVQLNGIMTTLWRLSSDYSGLTTEKLWSFGSGWRAVEYNKTIEATAYVTWINPSGGMSIWTTDNTDTYVTEAADTAPPRAFRLFHFNLGGVGTLYSEGISGISVEGYLV